MQQLHHVGYTADLDSLIFSTRKGAKSGGFVLRLDERLLETIAEAVRRRIADGDDLEVPAEILEPAPPPPRRQSQLSPREIQDRLRAGRSLEVIAAEAGVGEEWVARFAAPVEAERSQIVGRARGLVYTKPRRGDSAELLGTSVRWNLADRGVRLTNDEFDDGWSAYQIADHAWMVTFTFVSRKRTQEAEWEVDLATGELLSRNRLASDLGYVEPGRRRRSLASLQPVPIMGTKGARRLGAATAAAGDGDGDGKGDDEPRRARPASRASKAAKRPAKKVRSSAAKRPAKKATTAAKKAAARSTIRAATKRPAKAAAAKAAAAKRSAAPAKKAAKKAAKTATARTTPGRVAAGTAKRAPARKTTTAKRAVKSRKAAAPARPSRGRDVPPAPAPPAVAAARPEPNELGQRRLQLATGAPRPAGTGRPTGGRPPAPTPASAASARRGAPPRIAATRSIDRPVRPSPRPEPAAAAPPPAPPPEERLDVVDEAAAERRRAERRAARAAARAAGAAPVAAPPASNGGGARSPSRERADDAARPAPNGRPDRAAPAPDLPPGDGKVVTIRANRATPPTGEGDGDVIVPADRPPLRPAQPATQPRRRRFARTNR